MENQPSVCEKKCDCQERVHNTGLVVITGGPGAGKTAILEMSKKLLCEHIAVLPEAASIIFGGGFWRLPSVTARIAAQKAIFHVQQEMENLVVSEKKWAMGLCDRGTLDGFAYWPGDENTYWSSTGTSLQKEYNRYQAVIHLRTPSEQLGYNHQNPLRTETAIQALEIDKRIERAWSQHSKYFSVGSSENFLAKAKGALSIISNQLPDCCRKSLKLEDLEVLK